ncbi:MAG: exodeoxyribonuclease III, partial [Pseudomonadota bacterium]|nr:exodeoxyribonuclease III [Pseudomonadota bacterium]
LPQILDWTEHNVPDVLCLQEIKCETGAFPGLEFAALGYTCAVVGQKSYNGVAVLTHQPFESVRSSLPGDPTDNQARYQEIDCCGVLIANIYVPNGNPAPGPKYDVKLAWLDRLIERCEVLLAERVPFMILGDFNIIPEDEDVYDPKGWKDDALFRPEVRARFRALRHMGLLDALRAKESGPGPYTFWGYTHGQFHRDLGLRIDHILLSPALADRLIAVRVDKTPRANDKPSDHTPVIVTLT